MDELKVASITTLACVTQQSRMSKQLLADLRKIKNSLAEVLPYMRHTKSRELPPHE